VWWQASWGEIADKDDLHKGRDSKRRSYRTDYVSVLETRLSTIIWVGRSL